MTILPVKENFSGESFASDSSGISAAREVRDIERAVIDAKERPVRKANQLRRIVTSIGMAAVCSMISSGFLSAQLLPGATGQTAFDPYPPNQNPFRSGDGLLLTAEPTDGATEPAESPETLIDAPFLDESVQGAQFTEMIPDAVNEASLESSVLTNSNASVATPSKPASGVSDGAVANAGGGAIAGPELSGPMGEYVGPPIGEFTSEFAPVVTEEDSALLYSSSSWFRRGFWYSQQDFVMMLRTQVEEIFIASDQTLPVSLSRPQISMADANFTYEPGLKLTLGRFLGQDVSNRDLSVEFTFFGLLEHSGNSELEALRPRGLDTALTEGFDFNLNFDGNGQPFGAGTGIVGIPVAGFSGVDRQTISYNTQFNSYELNAKLMGRPKRDRLALQPTGAWVRHAAASRIVSGLIGFRAISLAERFRYQSFTDDALVGDYAMGVSNDMYGPQLGCEFAEYNASWAVGGRFKAGGLLNFAERHDSVEVAGDGELARKHGANDEHLAVLLEAGAFAVHHFSPNFTGRIGYDFMYMTGIADAPNNASVAITFSRFEITNDAFYHGLSLGFEMLW